MKDAFGQLENTFIDAHTHIGGVSYTNMLLGGYPYSQSVDELLKEMNTNGISHAITTPFPVFYGHRKEVLVDEALAQVLLQYEKFPYCFANRMMLEEIKIFGEGRFFPFVLMALNKDLEKQIEYISKLSEKYKIYGVKLYTVYDNVCLSEMINSHIFTEFLKRYKYPIMIHSSFDGAGDANDIVKFAEAYPEININIAHMARFKKKSLEEIKKLSNVYLDFSPFLMLCEFMKNIKKDDGNGVFCDLNYEDPFDVLCYITEEFPQKIMYGSDAPFYTVFEYSDMKSKEETRFVYKDTVKLLYKLPENIRERIVSKNVIDFLFGKK